MTTIFISGAEGVGKTTLINYLKKRLPNKEIYDFDELGVPANPPLIWRHKTTKHWLQVSEKNEKRRKDTLIVGLIFPNEILKFSKRKDIYFCLLEISLIERAKRLRKRNASKDVIKDIEQLKNLRKEFKELKVRKIINVSKSNPKEISLKLAKWICELK